MLKLPNIKHLFIFLLIRSGASKFKLFFGDYEPFWLSHYKKTKILEAPQNKSFYCNVKWD
jgi:hypothetical protein